MKNKKQTIINLFLGNTKPQKNDIKKQLGKLIEHVIYLYKTKNKEYPFTIKELETINDEQGKVLEQFYGIYKSEIEEIMNEIFVVDLTNLIENTLKEENKYPILKELSKDIFNTIQKIDINNEGFNLLMTEYIINKIINVPKNIQMRQLLKNAYLSNKELFKKFIFINLDKDKKYTEFENIGKEIKSIIESVEDQLLRHMENGTHSDKSVSVSDKYKKYISSIFPMYYNIGVKVKKMSKEEMAEYIKKMNNR